MLECFDCDGQELHMPYLCKVEQADAKQRDGMSNSETEMCITWKLLPLKMGRASH